MEYSSLEKRYGEGAERTNVAIPQISNMMDETLVKDLIEDQLLASHRAAVEYLSDRFERIERLRRMGTQNGIPQITSKAQQYSRLFRACSSLDSAANTLDRALLGNSFIINDYNDDPVNIPRQFSEAIVPETPENDEVPPGEDTDIVCGF